MFDRLRAAPLRSVISLWHGCPLALLPEHGDHGQAVALKLVSSLAARQDGVIAIEVPERKIVAWFRRMMAEDDKHR